MTIITSRLTYENSNYATMRFEPESLHGANNGLHVARGLMEEIKKEFDWISYGDLWTLAGVAAIQVNDRAYFLED
jgi:cytochrome c peroxidase